MNIVRIAKSERHKSPQQKKQEDYDKDMRPLIENPHAFRKNWPKKKARINRKRRHHLQTLLQAAIACGQADGLSPELLKTVEPLQQVKKQGIRSLRQNVQAKLKRRKQP